MLGLIPAVMMKMLREEGGQQAYKKVCEAARVAPIDQYRLDKEYGDREVVRMFEAAEAVLGMARPQLMDAYAQAFLRDALVRFPVFFKMAKNSREFLERQPGIHCCMASAVADKRRREEIIERFEIEHHRSGIIAYYRSHNRMAALYVSLAKAIVEYYEDEATITPLDDLAAHDCRIRIDWQRLGRV